ncbi:restriction endonuclease subunit S [Elongatibacter sediminis]|uniref:Restriction endonuclease subunit S n=1 Tax=Elongatibacter sediminis TaxID=3119006 RepID=A0AAW9REI1_9GAMM
MPADWHRHEVSELISEGKLIVGDGYRAKISELARDGLPFARAGNINDGFQFLSGDCFPAEELPRVGNKVSQPGDVVFTSKGTVGRFAFVRPETPRFVYSPQLCFWRSCDKELIHSRFLYYWMFGREFFVQFKGVAGQTDMAEYVSLTDQRRMHITLPSPAEQRAIARILGTLDDKIELNRRMSETLEAMTRALFKSWFVSFDPVRAKAEGRDPGLPKPLANLFPDSFEDSELGRIPKGWEVKPLDEIAHFQNGLALQKYRPRVGEARLPVVKIAQLRSGQADSGEWATAKLKPECVIDDGDIVFSWSGSLLVRIWCGGRAALNQHLFKVTSEDYPRWFYLDAILFHLPEFQRIAAGKATTMGHIQRHHLTSALCVVPGDDLLVAASPLFSGLVDRTVANDVQCRTLVSLRDALLPKLISGELRIEDAGRFLSGVE